MRRVIRSDRLTRWLAASGRVLTGVLWPRPERPHPWFDGAATGRGRLRRRLHRLTALYALIVITAASGAVLNDSHRMVGGTAFLLLLPYVAGLWLAARRPLDGWRLVSLWLLVTPFLIPPPAAPVPALEPWQWCLWVPVLLLAGMGRPARDAAAVGGASAVLLVALTWLTPWPVQAAELPLAVLGVAVPLVIGASIGARWSAQRALTEEQARVAAAQSERGALAERARVAREMHDVVAHHMSMIAVRCETAPYRISGLSEAGQAEIAEIGAAARTAMTEMQGLLGVLRESDPGGTGVAGRADLAPQPSIGDLAALHGGELAAGPDPDGGFTVRAVLPVPERGST